MGAASLPGIRAVPALPALCGGQAAGTGVQKVQKKGPGDVTDTVSLGGLVARLAGMPRYLNSVLFSALYIWSCPEFSVVLHFALGLIVLPCP